jgi:hypothetical protein
MHENEKKNHSFRALYKGSSHHPSVAPCTLVESVFLVSLSPTCQQGPNRNYGEHEHSRVRGQSGMQQNSEEAKRQWLGDSGSPNRAGGRDTDA